jgi:hypothetical protein
MGWIVKQNSTMSRFTYRFNVLLISPDNLRRKVLVVFLPVSPYIFERDGAVVPKLPTNAVSGCNFEDPPKAELSLSLFTVYLGL